MIKFNFNHEKLPLVFYPFYDDNGANITKITYADGSTTTEKIQIYSFVQKLHRINGLDYHAQRNFIADRLKITNQVPFTIANRYAYFYTKTRIPQGSKDGAFGCVNFFQVEDVKPYGSCSYIYFQGNKWIYSYLTASKNFEHIRNASLAYLYFISRMFPDSYHI